MIMAPLLGSNAWTVAVSSTEHEISAEPSYNQRQRRRQEQLCADAADGMYFLVIEQLPGTHKARGRDQNQGNPEKDEGEPVVTAKRSRQPFQLQSTSRIKRVRICHREHKQVELLDDEPECDHGDA